MKLTKKALELSLKVIRVAEPVSEDRKSLLDDLAGAIRNLLIQNGKAELIIICTHNSRRSHIGQIMLKLASLYYGIDGIFTFSGGTEATAMNERVVLALEDLGLTVIQLTTGKNPKYYIPLVNNDMVLDIHFSKPYDNSYNPQEGFIAVMVCNEADEACPIVKGAAFRISIPYTDPKFSDGSPVEREVYRKKVMEIGQEMFYVMSQIKMSGT